MFQKILIANRGEIALRIIRACREMGIATVAIYSEVDRDSLHVRSADEAFCVGPAPQAKSYANIPNIISAATLAGVDAIHPGYGLLSENARFAEICETHNIKFIGPPVRAMELMGDKAMAKKTMKEAGVPVIPGSDGPVTSLEEARAAAREAGYPILLKASGGGGGRGIRIVREERELEKAYQAAQSEAEAAFGNPELYVEKFIENPRHIEVQILADEYGHAVHLGERDCSIQRRHQKVIEEAPSAAMTGEMRAHLGELAVRGALAAGYTNAGTMEFLMDREGNFYFMEMNTRIQVEHPVTEFVTGIDLVKEQIRIAAGEPLGFTQDQVVLRGHAIECRINAEDPEKNFMPHPGRIEFYHVPGGPGIRVDSCLYTGYTVPPYYDSMVAKVIAWGRDRAEAVARMRRALEEMVIDGIPTTIPFHLEVLEDPAFLRGEIDTGFVEAFMNARLAAGA
ncbi:MAG: acetyl-CoA carboxylase biotin carboxylase subunit [Firmicutes bacterium]|nr:acetyl-CoA carboxylase biotin carboxylase subunit [Bacillota bacterium]